MSCVHWFSRCVVWLSWLVGYRTRHASDIGAGQTVVIVGGGFAGVALAHYLSSSTAYRVILYCRAEFFEYTPAMLRVLRDPSYMRVSHLPYAGMRLLLDSGVVIRTQAVARLHAGAVQAADGSWQTYDKLVLAMGSDYPDHIKPEPCCGTLEQRKEHVQREHDKIHAAKKITIFGGGLVGVELAAELCERWPSTPLVLRHRDPALLTGFPARAQRYAQRFFERRKNVQLVFGNEVPPAQHKAEEGEVVFNCTGLKPVVLPQAGADDASQQQGEDKTQGAKKQSGAAAESSHGPPLSPFPVHARTRLLRVSPHLQLVGHANVYAVGDVMVEDALLDQPSKRVPKVAYQAELQAWCVAENLRRGEEGRPLWRFPEDIVRAPAAPSIVCCSLGQSDGVLIANGLVLGGWLAVGMKLLLERSKMSQLRGGIFGEIVWFALEPGSIVYNKVYRAVAGLIWGRKESTKA